MTEIRKAELESIRNQKLASGIKASDSVVEFIESFKSRLDPSEFWECIYQVRERLEGLEREASDIADSYERANYGVSLEDIEGKFDEPIRIVDERRPPNGLPI